MLLTGACQTFCVYRGIWGSLQVSSVHGAAQLNLNNVTPCLLFPADAYVTQQNKLFSSSKRSQNCISKVFHVL